MFRWDITDPHPHVQQKFGDNEVNSGEVRIEGPVLRDSVSKFEPYLSGSIEFIPILILYFRT